MSIVTVSLSFIFSIELGLYVGLALAGVFLLIRLARPAYQVRAQTCAPSSPRDGPRGLLQVLARQADRPDYILTLRDRCAEAPLLASFSLCPTVCKRCRVD